MVCGPHEHYLMIKERSLFWCSDLDILIRFPGFLQRNFSNVLVSFRKVYFQVRLWHLCPNSVKIWWLSTCTPTQLEILVCQINEKTKQIAVWIKIRFWSIIFRFVCCEVLFVSAFAWNGYAWEIQMITILWCPVLQTNYPNIHTRNMIHSGHTGEENKWRAYYSTEKMCI